MPAGPSGAPGGSRNVRDCPQVRILIINTDYPRFLQDHYARHPRLATASYAEQMQARNDSFFGVFDAYSKAFQACGHEAIEIHANNGYMQRQWMLEAGERPPIEWKLPARAEFLMRRIANRVLPLPFDTANVLRSPFDIAPWKLTEILVTQVKAYRPDVILNQSVSEVGSDLLEKVRRHTKLIVGQIASPMPDHESYRAYDLMISSLPNFVAHYRNMGLKAELNRLAFDRRALDAVDTQTPDVDVSFVGSISPAHPARTELLDYVCRHTDVQVWGNGLESLPADSPIRKNYRGEAWGREMFRALGRSRITVNTHIGIAGNYANNMRLYEATGMGALLVTDKKSNLAEMFEPGKEVVCYESAEECLDLVEFYRKNESERARIAAAGQRRTLAEHTYVRRVEKLLADQQELSPPLANILGLDPPTNSHTRC